MSPLRSAPSNTLLWWIIGGAVLALIVLLVVVMQQPGSGPLAQMELAGQVSPTWGGSVVKRPELSFDADPQTLRIYVDVSHPMRGFLPPEGVGSPPPGFRSVIPLVADHLLGRFDGRLQWRKVAHWERPEVLDWDRQRRITRDLFDGKETRLLLAVQEMLADLGSGQAEAAALITDLVATEEHTGALAAATPLTRWMESDEVRSGVYGLGLLGVRATYWGAECPQGSTELGCWFSERGSGYAPLSQVAQVPFYVLLVGRGNDRVREAGEAIKTDAEELELEARWELLTQASQEPGPTTLSCRAHKPGQGPEAAQFALFREDDGHFRCVRDDRVELTCALPPQSKIVPSSVRSTWPEAVEARVEGSAVVATLDCSRLRAEPPSQELKLEIRAQRTADGAGSWEDWSKPDDQREEDLGKTLQLQRFVDTLRLTPDEYTIATEPLLQAGSHEH